METIETQKVYKGSIKDLTIISTNAFGIRTYRIGFGESKRALFQLSMKRTVPISEGNNVLFTGDWLSESIFMIKNIKDITGRGRQSNEMHLTEDSYRRLVIRQ